MLPVAVMPPVEPVQGQRAGVLAPVGVGHFAASPAQSKGKGASKKMKHLRKMVMHSLAGWFEAGREPVQNSRSAGGASAPAASHPTLPQPAPKDATTAYPEGKPLTCLPDLSPAGSGSMISTDATTDSSGGGASDGAPPSPTSSSSTGGSSHVTLRPPQLAEAECDTPTLGRPVHVDSPLSSCLPTSSPPPPRATLFAAAPSVDAAGLPAACSLAAADGLPAADSVNSLDSCEPAVLAAEEVVLEAPAAAAEAGPEAACPSTTEPHCAVLVLTPANTRPTTEDLELAAPIASELAEALTTCQQLDRMLRAVSEACWLVRRRHPDIALLQVTCPHASSGPHITMVESMLLTKYAPTCSSTDAVLSVLAGWTGSSPEAPQPQPLAHMLQVHMPDVWAEVAPMAEHASGVCLAAHATAAKDSPEGSTTTMESAVDTSCGTSGFQSARSTPQVSINGALSQLAWQSAGGRSSTVAVQALPDLAQLLLGSPMVQGHRVLRSLDARMSECVAWWNSHWGALPRRLLMQLGAQLEQLQRQLEVAQANMRACLADIAEVEKALTRPLVFKPVPAPRSRRS